MTLVAVLVAACGSDTVDTATSRAPTTAAPQPPATDREPGTTPPDEEGCAHVVGVDVRPDPGGYTFSVTVSSSETGWDKYADLWVVKTPDGTVLGERVLAHPHVEEQPFTRSQSGIVIPEGVTEVTVAARDSVLGFCGDEMPVTIPQEDA